MSLEIDVLRALLRLARRRTPPTLEQIVVRVGGDDAAVRTALASLARRSLVQRTPAGLRLSLAGLAVAVAVAQRPKSPKAPEGQEPKAAPAPKTRAVVRGRKRAA